MGMTSDCFLVNGKKQVNDQFNGVAYLGGTWKRRRTGFEGMCPYTMDVPAHEMMAKWQQDFKERRDELVGVLGINLNWRMHECSDGSRRPTSSSGGPAAPVRSASSSCTKREESCGSF